MNDSHPPAVKPASLDLQTHLAELEAQGLLIRIDHPVNGEER